MINCLIVDDEPLARDIMRNFCSHLPDLHIVGDCGNALEAKRLLNQQQVDLLFLDINLPVLDGVAFLKTLKQVPQVIFTTAYKDYAVNAFDLDACDYLVKPFSLERFIVAVDKAIARLNPVPAADTEKTVIQNSEYFFIKVDGKIFNLKYSEVLFAEAKGNFTRVVTGTGSFLTAVPFSQFEEQLPRQLFGRVHRSYIVNKSVIHRIEGNTIFIAKYEIPVSSHYKLSFLKGLGM